MGKRTTQKGGRGAKSTTDALAYASKIEKLAQDKKRMEKEVRQDIDRISDDMGQMVSSEVEVGKAPQHLEKARAAADRKDFKVAQGHLDRAEKALIKAASPVVEKRISEAQDRINAVERLGVVEADLSDQMDESRKLYKQSQLLAALGTAEGASKRAIELAKNQLTEVVSISEMLIKDAEAEGLDVSRSEEYLAQARSAVDKGDYEAAVEATLQIQTSLDRARKGLTSDAAEGEVPLEDLVGEEDREFVSDMIQQGLEKLETDIGVLEEIRGLVTHPENLVTKVRKALDEGNLTQSRKLLREAHLATLRATRERLDDVLTAARDRMKKAKRDGLSIQEVRSAFSQSIMAVEDYRFKEAYDLALSIEDRIAQVKEEREELLSSLDEAEMEIAALSEIGTNEARVQELIDQARKNLDRGDFKKARLSIAKALSTARTSTQNFINNYIIEVRNLLLSVRTIGGNIATARPMLITAKKEMNKKDFTKAVELVNDSILTIKGVDQEYLDTLQEVMKSKFNLVLGESLGLSVAEVGDNLDQAFQELNKKSFDKAIKLAQKTDFEVEILIEDFKTTSEDLATAKEAIGEGKKVGADVGEADFLLSKAVTQIEKNNFEVAQELLNDAIAAADKARSERVGALLEDAKSVIEEEDRKGVQVDTGKQLIKEAEQAYKRADYPTTIDLINEAIEFMGEASRRFEEAQEELQQAEELMEENRRYAEENPLAEDFISTARNLLAGGQYIEAFDVARQAIVDLESGLVRYIDLIMEDTKSEIGKSEESGAVVPQARDMYKLARRYLDRQEPVRALALARKASSLARETLEVYQEVTEKLDLLDSYIQWGKRVSRKISMPMEDLEAANALVKEKKFHEAQSIVNKALEEAKQAQISFVNQELESVEVFLKELESGGVGTSVARNTLNQAHNSLEDLSFEQAYTLASQAREQGLKNQELYREIVEKMHKGSERLSLAENLGVDIRSLKELVDKTEKALINQTYTFALDFVDQLLAELPKATQVYINRRFNDASALLEECRDGGIIVTGQDELMERAKEVAARGELERTVETLDTLEQELGGLRERQTEAKGALTHLAEVLEAAEEIGVETSSPRGLEADASTAFIENRFKEVHGIVAEAEDELIRTSSTFIVDYINRVQSTIDRLEQRGAYVRRMEDRVDEAWSQLDSRRFTEAFATARECTIKLQEIEERFPSTMEELRSAESQVARMGFMDVDVGDAMAVLSSAHEAMADMEFDAARRHISEALDELSKAIKAMAEAQIIELDGLIEANEAEGADLSSARERLERSRSLLDSGEAAQGFIMSLQGVEAAHQARREMNDAIEGEVRAKELYDDAEDLGADMTRAKELMVDIEEDLKSKRYRDVLYNVRRLMLETDKAKADRVLNLLGEGGTAIIEAEELGLSVKVLRQELKAAEELLEQDDFKRAAAEAQDTIDAARLVIGKFTKARDRIVEVQSVIYDASGIGTNTGAATDLLGEARDALADQLLDEALDLANRSKAEVDERQKEMLGYEMEAIEDVMEDASNAGMVLTPLENAIEQAKELSSDEDYKGAILRLREGIQEGKDLLVSYNMAQESLERADQLVKTMSHLQLDTGVPAAELEKAERLVPKQEYEQSKELSDTLIGDVTRILNEHIAERTAAVNAKVAEAMEVGISVGDIETEFASALEEEDPSDFVAVSAVIDNYEADVAERTAAYDDAKQRIEEAQTLFSDAEELQVDVSTALPSLEEARSELAGGRYPEASKKGDEAKQKVLELQKQFVLKYIKDAEDLIAELQSLGIDTIEPSEYLDQARAALDLEEYPPAHGAAMQAINSCQHVKDQYNEASALIEEAKAAIKRASDLGVDTTPASELLEQAIDSLEFQSYDESKDFATKTRQRAGELMQDHVESALEGFRAEVERAQQDGVEVSKGSMLLEQATASLEAEDFIGVQDAVDVGMVHMEQRRALHDRAEKVHETLFEEVENAETLGVEVGVYEVDVQQFRSLYEDREYQEAIGTGLSLLRRLATDQRAMVELYVGEVSDLMDSFIDEGGVPSEPLDLLQRSLDYLGASDFIRSYNFVVRARETIEEETRIAEEVRQTLHELRNTIVWSEGVGVPVEDGRAEMERAVQLYEGSRFGESLDALKAALEAAIGAIAQMAKETLTTAEERAKEVHSAGASSAMVMDRVSRGKRSLEDEDFGYALLFAQLALSTASKAEKQLKAARSALVRVEEKVDLARKILSDPSEVETFHVKVTDALDARRIPEAIRLSRVALSTIDAVLGRAIQDHIDAVQEDLKLMEHMGIEGASLANRLDEARQALEGDDYLEAYTVVTDVREPVHAFMRDKAGASLEDAKEAVDAMRTIGAQDPEVVQGMSQTQDLFAVDDYYHSNELSLRTAQRAREVSDLFISKLIGEIKQLIEEADLLGVDTSELERRVDRAERRRNNQRFVDAKEALDELAEDVDAAQRELVDTIVSTCDKLDVIVQERELEASEAPHHLQEAHHYLSLRNYKGALESAKASFSIFEEVFTKLVRDTLEEAKNLLVNLDVSADIESSSDHYVKAEEALSRKDYVDAVANADATMANARVIQVRIIEEILTETDSENKRGAAMGADMTTSEDLTREAKESLAANNLEDAQSQAMRARDEARNLQQTHSSSLIQASREYMESVPFEMDLADVRQVIESAQQSHDAGDFEAAADAAIQAEAELTDRMESHVRKTIIAAEGDLEKGKEAGIDLTVPKDLLKDAKGHSEARRFADAQAAASRCQETVADLIAKHQEAERALSDLMELVERASRARSKLSEAMDMQEAAEDAMDEHDYSRVVEMVKLAMVEAQRSYENRVKEAISDAEGKLSTLESMGASAKLADDLLAMAREAMEQEDLDGAYDYADQSIKEADTAKTSFRDIIDITFQAESLIGTAKGFGMDVSEAQARFDEALSTRSEDVNRALALAEEAKAIATSLVDSFYPELQVDMELESALVNDVWTNANLVVRNDGTARALRTRIELAGNLDVDGLGEINLLRGNGKSKKLPVRVKPKKSGEIMVRVTIGCDREYDDKPYQFHDVRWLMADEEETEDSEPGAQFLRKGLTCTICQGKIGTQDAPRACSCGATFHVDCAEQLEECPNCGKSLGGE